eukprot:TRINITY_DN2191_c0_g1_i2.p1 TRINITY_DN2191_c0_g1~~TRINITY_DN2191_c0_g1_i2.p1  ORF type:complete len:122 (-),score=25.07 TRINITY_DN2191_c0_g1_i2:39-404(-)
MSSNEAWEPRPSEIGHGLPLIYSEMIDITHQPFFNFVLRVWESDTLIDDKMFEEYISVAVDPAEIDGRAKRAEKEKNLPPGMLGSSGPWKWYPSGKELVIKNASGSFTIKLLISVANRPEW